MALQMTIIGLGAMACLFAGKLGRLAHITMLGSWPAQIEALNTGGLTLIHPDGRQSHHFVKAAADSVQSPPADVVLILVKTPNTAAAAQKAAAVLKPDGLAVTLQNGLGNLEIIAAVVGPERAAQGVTSDGAAMLRPGVVRHAGAGQSYLAENMAGTAEVNERRNGRLKEVAALFNQGGFETQLVENADSLIWGKLAVNTGINPLTALLQVPNGFLIENDDARWLMSQAAQEAAAVAAGLNIPLPYANAAERAAEVARATAANHSSMAQDVARGAPTEIESICGPVVEHGRRLGLPTPVNGAFLALVRQQTDTGRWLDALEHQPPEIRRRFISIITREQMT
jgi:2-dehydropantoate 2-reductase